jgi:uncharacterized damage-inducible protein DinB
MGATFSGGSPMSLQELIEGYLGGIQTLRQAVAGMTAEQVRARPVPGKWSTLEAVCHLTDFEPIYADRMKRIIAEDRPLLLSADQERFAATLAYGDRDLNEELNIVESTRRQMARIFRKLPAEALKREGVYRHEGKDEVRTLERFITLITNHINHHVKFIAEKRAALGLK